jgi:hypothetical protein
MYTKKSWIKTIALIGITGCLLLGACSPVPGTLTAPQETSVGGLPATATPSVLLPLVISGQPADYEVVAQDAPLGTFRLEPLVLALRGDGAAVDIPSDLPPGAIQAIQVAQDKKDPALYLLIYAGAQHSGGFSVQIDSLSQAQENGQDTLLARYHVQPPDPTKGAETAITFPYLVTRVATDLLPAQVRFEAANPPN